LSSTKLRLNSNFSFQKLHNGDVVLHSDSESRTFADHLVPSLINQLDSGLPLDQVLQAHCAYQPLPLLTALVEELLQQKVLLKSPAYGPRPISAAVDLGLHSLNPPRIHFLNLLEDVSLPLESLLTLAGFDVVDPTESAAFTLVMTHDYLSPGVADLAVRTPNLLLARPAGAVQLLGPYFDTPESSCYHCLNAQLATHRWQLSMGQSSQHPAPQQPAWAASPATILQFVSWLSATIQRSGLASLSSRILSFDFDSFAVESHPLLPHESCPHSHSHSSLRSIASLSSPITGIATDLECSAAPFLGHHHAKARLLTPYPDLDFRPWQPPLAVFSASLTLEQAKTVVLAEAAERHSIYQSGFEPILRAPAQGIPHVLPGELSLIDESQLQTLRLTPLTIHDPIGWLPAQSCTGGPSTNIPAGNALLWYCFRQEPEYCIPDSNGAAAGPTIEAALNSALLELIERDALALWWYSRALRPAPPLSISFIESACSTFATEQMDVHWLDITSDLGIPVCLAVASNRDGSQVTFASGAAFHFDDAAARATKELTQILYWSRQNRPFPELFSWWRTAHRDHLPHFNPHASAVSATHAPTQCGESLPHHLHSLGYPSYWMALTRPHLQIPVARAFVPGLRPHWQRLAPGRLYEVPLNLGWVPGPLTITSINPLECFI
jgi:bacteriocin biosynthesis cyclodehydratase domain-containing protein